MNYYSIGSYDVTPWPLTILSFQELTSYTQIVQSVNVAKLYTFSINSTPAIIIIIIIITFPERFVLSMSIVRWFRLKYY